MWDMSAHDHEPAWTSTERLTSQAALVSCVFPGCDAKLIVIVGDSEWEESSKLLAGNAATESHEK